MVLAGFVVQNKLRKIWFCDETFLLADTNMEVVLEMPFLILSNANMQFVEKELEWKSYITARVLYTTKRVDLIDKKEFAITALDKNTEMFMVYIATFSAAPTM